MTGWGGGYVTDVAYTAGHYPFQSPLHLEVACLLRSVRPPTIGPGLSYVELGCGRGYGALILAASNPDWTVTAIDFHPAHIAESRSLAREAGLSNVTFHEADLSDPATVGLLPEADIVSLHGVWSWVPPGVRRGIVAVLQARLRAGGLAHVSYNALPGWQGALGMQRVLREAGLRAGGRSDGQAVAGMKLVRELAAAEAHYLGESALVQQMLGHAERLPAEYVAHEYMNAAWRPCFHMDVCADLAEARLEWAGSTQLVDCFPELSLSPAQRDIVSRYDDPMMRELVRDMCQERSLRNDIFVRGMRRFNEHERDDALRAVLLALVKPREAFKFAVGVPAGEAALEPAFYGPVADRLAEGPCTVGDLLAMPELEGRRRDNPAELLGMLVGSQQAIPVARGTDGKTRLNDVLGARYEADSALNARAAWSTPAWRTGMPCTVVELAVWRRLAARQPIDPAALSRRLLPYGEADELARMQEAIAVAKATPPAIVAPELHG